MNGSATLCRTPPHATPLPRIHEALRAVWQSCRSENAGTDVARALAINFVGVAAAADEGDLRAAVDRLQRRTPCRAFLLLVDDTAPRATAEVSATTRLTRSTQDIVLEEIVVRLPAAGFRQMPGLVRPLLVDDLPNHLFWGASWPGDERHFDELVELCDHCVVDSRRFATPAVELHRVAERRARGSHVSDLGWLRLRPWRRALAEAYERLPGAAGRPTRVRIVHGTGSLAAAMLLGQWLEQRLDAAVSLADEAQGSCSCPDRVVLHAGDDEVDIGARGDQIVVHVTTTAHCLLPFTVPASRGTDGDLLAAAIDIG